METSSEFGKEFQDERSRASGTRWVLVALISTAGMLVLAVDLSLPLGVAVGSLYCLLVLASFLARDVRATLTFAVLFSVMVGCGWVLSEPRADAWIVSFNRMFSIALIWLSATMAVYGLTASERFRTAVHVAPAGMVVATRRGRVLSANAEAARILHAPEGRLRKTDLRGVIPLELSPASVDSSVAQSPDIASTPGTYELRCRRLDGECFLAEVSLRQLKTLPQLVLVMLRDLTQDQLEEQANERLATLVRSSPDAIFGHDLAGQITDCNPAAEAMFGYGAQEIVGTRVAGLFPRELRPEVDGILERVHVGEVVSHSRTRAFTKAGETIDVDLALYPIRNRRGEVVGASTIARDRTKEREAERLTVELNTALSLAMQGIAIVDREGQLTAVNDPFADLMMRAPDQLLGIPWRKLLTRSVAKKAFHEMLRDGRSEVTVRTDTDRERYLELFLVKRLDADGRFRGFYLFARDVTERALSNKKVRELAADLQKVNLLLKKEAHLDPLSGLLNRRGLEEELERLRRAEGRKRSKVSVILVDIDDFKQFNSQYGHVGGDRVLVSVARSLQQGVRGSDLVARIGGDEFLLMLPDTRLGEAVLRAERLRASIAEGAMKLDGDEVAVTCSFGVVTVRTEDTTIEKLVEAARAELSQAKDGGKDRVCTRGEESSTPLREILSGRGLRAYHQPIYDLLENRIAAFELLVRGPPGRYESPQSFLDLLHPGEGMVRLDLACLRACLDAATNLPESMCVHCNLFPFTLISVGAKQILRELERARPRHALCIELNEHDIPGASRDLLVQVQALKAAGVLIAIDDVGFGNSSLEALIHLEPDVIKIDRSCLADAERLSSLERFLTVANVLRARVIAEGIEDEQHLERLRALHVRFGQGYLLGHPEPLEAGSRDLLWPQPRSQGRSGRRAERTPHGPRS